MAREVVTADPDDPIEQAANTMRERRIGCLPVLEGNELVGIVTASDVMEALVYLVGANEPGSRMEVAVPDRPGALAGAAGVFGMCGINIVSAAMGATREPREEGCPEGAHSRFQGGHHRHQRGGRIPGGGRLLRVVAAETLSGRAAIVHDLALEDYGFGGDHPFNPLRLRLALELCEALRTVGRLSLRLLGACDRGGPDHRPQPHLRAHGPGGRTGCGGPLRPAAVRPRDPGQPHLPRHARGVRPRRRRGARGLPARDGGRGGPRHVHLRRAAPRPALAGRAASASTTTLVSPSRASSKTIPASASPTSTPTPTTATACSGCSTTTPRS